MGFSPVRLFNSKKSVAVSLIVFVLILASAGFFYFERSTPGGVAIGKTETQETPDLLKDPDGDGLKNWEEAIWGTDPNNPDSDGDGVRDGDEVSIESDPIVQGRGAGVSLSTDGTATADLTREILANGTFEGILQGEGATKLNEYLAISKAAYFENEQRFIASQSGGLRYSDANDPASVKAYLNAVATIYLEGYETIEKSDLEIIQEVLKDQSAADIVKLDPYIRATELVWKKVAALETPNSLKEFHEKSIKIHLTTLFELATIRNIEKDAFPASIALQKRLLTKIQMTRLYDEEVRRWLAAKQISFADEEIGRQMFGW